MWFAMAGQPGIRRRPGPGCATTGRGSLSLSGRPGRTPGGGTGKQLGLGLRLGSLPVWAASSSSASKARGFPRRRLRVRARRPRCRRRAGCAGHSYLHCKPLRTWIHSYNFAREFTVIFLHVNSQLYFFTNRPCSTLTGTSFELSRYMVWYSSHLPCMFPPQPFLSWTECWLDFLSKNLKLFSLNLVRKWFIDHRVKPIT